MKILLVISSLSNGGAERVVCRLASELCSRHEVHVACTYPVGNANGTYPIDPRVTVHTINSKYNIFARTPALAYHAEQRSKAKNLRALKRRERFDVCASFLTSCNYNNVMSRAGEPTLISIRNMLEPTLGAERLTPDAMKRVIAKTGRMADMVVCVATASPTSRPRSLGSTQKRSG